MAILLKDLIVGMNDKVASQVINTFIRESEILEMLPFDDAVSPGGGSTLTYGYVQEKLPSATSFRAINSEYTSSEATTEKKTVDLKVFGGSFEIDRVIKDAEGQFNNMAFQIEQKVKSAVGTFHDAMINGDSASNSNQFDGLDKFLVGQETEFGVNEVLDLSTMAKLKENADVFYEKLLQLINETGAQALLVNSQMKTKIQTVARVLGYKTDSEQAFGRTVTTIGENGVRLIDLKNVVTVSGEGDSAKATKTPIIGTKSRTVGGNVTTGLTDIYAVKFSVQDGFHGVTLTGDRVIKKYLPDFNTPGAVKKGEVEMVGCVALKNTNNCGVLRNVKII